MPLRSINRRAGKVLVGAVLAGVFASAASAGISLDLRVKNSAEKTVVVAGPGAVVDLEVYAIITATPGDDGLTNGNFGVKSSNGGLLGNLSNTIVAPWRGSGVQDGTVADLDGDGDLDVGSNNNRSGGGGNPVQNTWPFARTDTNNPILGNEHKLADVKFTVTGNSGETLLNVFSRVKEVAGTFTPWTWLENGTLARFTAIGGAADVGAPVRVVIPEPASLGFAAIAGLGLLARRRQA